MKSIGIIGCGAIGTQIAGYIGRNFKNKARLAVIYDVDSGKSELLLKNLSDRPMIAKDIDELMEKVDLIIECASMQVSGEIAEKAVSSGKDVIIMSTGGLLSKKGIFEKARSRNVNIYLPSGAICGLDGIRSACIGKIEKVILTTRKPLEGLKGAPYLKEKHIDIDGISEEALIFSGTAKEAVKYFPQNINVASTLSIYGIGPELTMVRIFTSPEYKRNIHEIEVEGEFGRLFTRTENVPSKENPKTSQLAIFSAIAKLEEIL